MIQAVIFIDPLSETRATMQALRRYALLSRSVDQRWVEIPVQTVPTGPGWLTRLRENRALMRKMQAVSAQNVQAVCFASPRLAAAAPAVWRKIPSIVLVERTPRQAGETHRLAPRMGFLSSQIAEIAFRAVCARASRCLATSEWTVHSLTGPYALLPSRVVHFFPREDLELWQPVAVAPGRRSRCRLVFMGTDFLGMGGEWLLQAVRQIGTENLEVEFITPEKRASQPGISFHPNLDPLDLEARRILAGADLFVLPSLSGEGAPSLVRAQACGLPSIVSSAGGLPELIADGETGRIIPPGDRAALEEAIRQFIENPLMRRQMAQAARRRAKSLFDAESGAQQLLGWFEQITAFPPSDLRP